MYSWNQSPVCSVTPLLWLFGPCRHCYCSGVNTAATSQIQEVQRFVSLLRTHTRLFEDGPQSSPYFPRLGPRGGKARLAEDRTDPQVRAIFSCISSSVSSQLPWLLQDVGIFVMEILYNITTGPKAAYTGPQLNSAAGTEQILL